MESVHPLETYLASLAEIRASAAGTKETSYYPALHALLNEVGKDFKPKVRCILQLANHGAGNPDGGLYTADQFQKMTDDEPIAGQKPSRGAIEIKPVKDDAWVTADSEQVTKYWKEYGQVLVSNYRDFVLVGRDSGGQPTKLGSYRLAKDAKSFWNTIAAHPKKTVAEQGDRFLDFLKLVILSPAVLVTPKDVAWVLAYYAREAKSRVEDQATLPALATVRNALEQALGLKFEGAKGEHFFRSSLVQTLFYGVFSAWVLWSKEHAVTGKDKFDWKLAQWSLRVPMIRALFEQIATPGQLGPLELVEVLDWTTAALNRVDRAAFSAQFQEQEAVLYFYEPFLEAFDPELRKDLGVWYTPLEVVKYMVARTDAVLRQELGVEDGFANKNVYVLDPGCGTGAYLVHVLNTIAKTLKEKGDDALAAHEVKQAAMQRVFGFELLPAPFVISHLQLGVLLQNLGAPLAQDGTERVGVYLTNSLTGWEPPNGPKQHLIFPAMEAERDAAEKVKREVPILVVIGNPPYNAFAGVSPAEEERLVEPYKDGLVSKWKIKKFNLDDLYVRFFRLAERRIAEKTGRGVVCYISNFSYLSDVSFVVMRKRFLEEFDKLWFDCMNGDSRETGKLTPDGKPDPSVFSTNGNPVGIRVGTAVTVLVRRTERQKPEVRFRHFWGVDKRKELLASLATSNFDDQYEKVYPDKNSRYSFRPEKVAAPYLAWPRVIDFCASAPMNGLMEKRAGALIDTEKDAIAARMQAYFNRKLEWNEYKDLGYGLTKRQARFDPKRARQKATKIEQYDVERIVQYTLRPFETRWAYYTGIRPVWNEPRPQLWKQVFTGNSFLMTRPAGVASPEGVPFFITRLLGDNDALRGHAYYIPVLLKQDPQLGTLFAHTEEAAAKTSANLSGQIRAYLEQLGIAADAEPSLLWNHVLAIGYSPAYLLENGDGIRRDWPRIPLPDSAKVLSSSASLGDTLSSLLNDDHGVGGVTTNSIRTELKLIGNIATLDGKPPDIPKDLAITAGWGHGGDGEATMPGKGRLVERDYTNLERDAINEGVSTQGFSLEQALAQLGETTCDVYLNERVYWKNIPVRVWAYTIGGYQVIKKWLSYRENDLLGRAITPAEAHYVRDIARRIAAVCLLQPQLDANYAAVKANTHAWPQPTKAEADAVAAPVQV